MSHYDVVPAPESTFDRWTHGAFSGYNDGKMIWGRGAADDKTLLVAQCDRNRRGPPKEPADPSQGRPSRIYWGRASSPAEH